MASAQASAQVSIKRFVTENPLNIEDVLQDLGINSTPIKVAIAYGHGIAFQLTYSTIKIDDEAQIGKNTKDRKKLMLFSNQHKIQFSFENDKDDFVGNFSFYIWLNDKIMPFTSSIDDIISRVAPQSHNVCSFVALTLAYDEMDITISNVLNRAYDYQNYGLPPMRSSSSIILTKPLNIPTSSISNFYLKTVNSPILSPVQVAPPSILPPVQVAPPSILSPVQVAPPSILSPVQVAHPLPSMVQISKDDASKPENEVDESEDEVDESEDEVDESEDEKELLVQSAVQTNEKPWQTQGRSRRQTFGATSVPSAAQANVKSLQTQDNAPRQIFGAGAPPLSVSVGSTYNGKAIGRPQVYVREFQKFYENGEKGVEVDGVIVKIPELDRLRRYTSFVIRFHNDVSGKNPNDPKVISYMKENLGEHFNRWNQYDWSKINLAKSFPEENPPMKSS
jgi:hypothetical protein